MSSPERPTRTNLMKTLESKGFRPRHDLGQNFLIDLNLLQLVVSSAELEPRDVVLEVGAGTGGMTALLAEGAGRVVSVEIDPRVYGLALAATAKYPNLKLLNCDALRDKNHLRAEVLEAVRSGLDAIPDARLKLVANLPYCVATPVISNLFAEALPLARMVVTIQYELAERMQAPPRSSEYSALSVWLQSQARVEILRKLGPTVFWPRPKVDSAIVLIEPDSAKRAALGDATFFHDFIRRLFLQRRKTLRPVLVGMYGDTLGKAGVDAVLEEFGCPDGTRAEELAPEDLIRLSRAVAAASARLPPPRP